MVFPRSSLFIKVILCGLNSHINKFESKSNESREHPIKSHKKTLTTTVIRVNYAEEEGFEPPVPRGTLVFKTNAIDHSATPLNYISIFQEIISFN